MLSWFTTSRPHFTMNARKTTRWVWFAGLWLLFPWALPVYVDAFVPAIRYVLLAVVTCIMALTEGSSGPVQLITTLFVVWGTITTLLSALLAWLISRFLESIPSRAANLITGICLAIGFAVAIFSEPYRTPFGRALRGGLFQVLS
jgi:hypothetical protein